jgi:hypothetical protein
MVSFSFELVPVAIHLVPMRFSAVMPIDAEEALFDTEFLNGVMNPPEK